MKSSSLRVCYFGTYRAEYSRNQVMLAALRSAGVQVLECHEPLWGSIEERVELAGGAWGKPGFWLRLLRAYLRLLLRFFSLPEFDLLVVGYPGQFDVFLARPLAWLRRKPLVWDVFMSIYLISLERGLDQRSPATVGLLRWLERLALRLPDRLIQDTAPYVAWLEQTHGLPPGRFRLVPTGADDRVYTPQPPPSAVGRLRVLYYGTYIPNHHVQTIIEAARLLADQPQIEFELIGDGPDRPQAEALVRQYGLERVFFTGWLAREQLVARAGAADICLGAFGVTPQSLMTVHNKVYEALALARPLITGDSLAMRQALLAGEEVWLVPRQDPAALAEAIRRLAADPALRRRLAEQGHARFMQDYSLERLGRRYAAHLQELLAEPKRS